MRHINRKLWLFRDDGSSDKPEVLFMHLFSPHTEGESWAVTESGLRSVGRLSRVQHSQLKARIIQITGSEYRYLAPQPPTVYLGCPPSTPPATPGFCHNDYQELTE